MAGLNSPLHLPVGRSSDFIIHIYSCDQWVMKGSVSHVQSGRSMAFHSLMQMILAVQNKMNEIGYPQTSTSSRSWQSGAFSADASYSELEFESGQPEDMMPESIQASFLIRIQFRQNASWQGTLIWMDNKESCAFRSLLELISLIADAVLISQTQYMETEKPSIARTLINNEDVL